MRKWVILVLLPILSFVKNDEPQSWIRINQLGYTPDGVKIAVWCSKEQLEIDNWQLVEVKTKKIATSGKAGNAFGTYGPFKQTFRLNFSSFKKPGRYYLQAGGAKSPEFEIGNDVYKGVADFCLRYRRQQRTGFNSKQSHTQRTKYQLE